MKFGKSALTVLSAIAFAGAMAAPAIAGHPFRNTDKFLSNHPDVATALQQNPKLIDDPAFVKSHPDLAKFLKHHPEARAEFREHPEHFMHKAERIGGAHN